MDGIYEQMHYYIQKVNTKVNKRAVPIGCQLFSRKDGYFGSFVEGAKSMTFWCYKEKREARRETRDERHETKET